MVELLNLTALLLVKPLSVKSTLGVIIEISIFCGDCPLIIGGRNFTTDLIMIVDDAFDVILAVDWLKPNHALIDCYDMVMIFCIPEQHVFHYSCGRLDSTLELGILAHVEFGST